MSKINLEACIAACNEALAACNACNKACIENPRVKELLRSITLNRDCALFCNTAALLLQHGSEFLRQICTLCAEACEVSAQECGRFDLPECKRAVAACHRCANECRRALQMIPASPSAAQIHA